MELDPADKAILDSVDDATDAKRSGFDVGRGRADPEFEATWLMRTTHMSKFGREVGYGQALPSNRRSNSGAELMTSTVDPRVMAKAEGRENIIKEQYDEAEASFTAVKAFDDVKKLVNPYKKNQNGGPLKAALVLPILPNVERLDSSFYEAIYEDVVDTGLDWCDTDTNKSIAVKHAAFQFANANNKNENIIGYLLPKKKPTKEEEETREREYEWVNEYSYQFSNRDDDLVSLWPRDGALTWAPVSGRRITMETLVTDRGKTVLTIPSRIVKRKRDEREDAKA